MNRFSWGICAVLTIASSLSTAFARSEDDPFFDGGNVDQLAELGWDLTKPLDMDFLLSFEHASDAEAFSRKLTSLGYTTEIRPCAKDPCTLIVATKLMVPNRAQIVEHGKKLDEMVVDYYGRYLGWVTDMFLRVDEELQKNVRAATHQGNVLVAATIVPRMWVETIISVCARRAPLTTPEGELAAAAWQQRNKLNLDTLDELLARFPSYLEKTTGFGGGNYSSRMLGKTSAAEQNTRSRNSCRRCSTRTQV